LLTANRKLSAPDTNGVIVARPTATPGVAGQVAFWQDANNLISTSNLFWDNTNTRLGIGTNTPSANLHVVGSARITGLNAAQFVKSDVNGNLSNALVSLSTDISGVLSIANGGTNSNTALNNNRIMISAAGAIVEHTALTAGSVFFADANGLPGQNNANFFWDAANSRLGLGTNTPARLLDVNGTSAFRGSILWAMVAKGTKQWFQGTVSTTDATLSNAASFAVPADTTILIVAEVVGRRTGGSAGTAGDSAAYIRTARFKNIGGVVTRADLQTDFTSDAEQRAWDSTIVVSGTNAVVQVKGAANNDIDWHVDYSVIVM
jgi:hypothetical protein